MMSMCRVLSCVVGRGCLLWPVCSLGKTLLAFALLHSVLQGQICLLLQVFLDFLLLHSSPQNVHSWIFLSQRIEDFLLCVFSNSRLTLCDPTYYRTPGFLVLHYLLEFAQTHVHWVSDAIQPSHPSHPSPHATSFSSCPQSFPASGSFPMSRLFTSNGQSVGI